MMANNHENPYLPADPDPEPTHSSFRGIGIIRLGEGEYVVVGVIRTFESVWKAQEFIADEKGAKWIETAKQQTAAMEGVKWFILDDQLPPPGGLAL